MSKYTTQLRYICEHFAGMTSSVDLNGIDNVINIARPKLFSFSYPIWDSQYKTALETKIIQHYWMREIGLETVGLFQLKLRDKMQTAMPKLNPLYLAFMEGFNPIANYEKKETGTDTTKNTTERVMGGGVTVRPNTTIDNLSKYQDTPQGSVADLKSGRYLTSATHDTSTTSGSTTTENNTSDDTDHNGTFTFDHHSVGISGSSRGELIKAYLENMTSPDEALFMELDELFMRIF